MNICKECGKKIGIFGGYRHPALGRNAIICSDCYDTVHESFVKWREVNLPYVGFFKNNGVNKNYNTNLNEILPDWTIASNNII